jgi:hydroxyacyl-ACP dehydratase HTD2-like protein with hotdog domain
VTKEWVEKYFKTLSYPYEANGELPHSFYGCLREGEFKVFADLGISLKQLLHVSQTFQYFKSLKVGDRLTSTVSIAKVMSRKLGGDLVTFLELKNVYSSQGETYAIAEGTVIVRGIKQ